MLSLSIPCCVSLVILLESLVFLFNVINRCECNNALHKTCPLISSILSFVAGVISREKLPAFERMLWRACRGNVFLRQAMIESPLEDPTNVSTVRRDQRSNLIIYINLCRAIRCTNRCSSSSSKEISWRRVLRRFARVSALLSIHAQRRRPIVVKWLWALWHALRILTLCSARHRIIVIAC